MHPIPTFQKPKGRSCWSHNQRCHHFFLSYRVAFEGKSQDPVVCVIFFLLTLVFLHTL